MAEQPSRKRQVVRRVTLTVATVLLLFWGYLGSWMSMWWLLGRGALSYETVETLQATVYAPAVIYCMRGYPGGRFTAKLTARFQRLGREQRHEQSPPDFFGPD